MAKGVFISYRRNDTPDVVDHLHSRLEQALGKNQVFRDSHSIPTGQDFKREIYSALVNCSVVLVVIGPNWVGDTNNGLRRINDPSDFVRLEVELALECGEAILVLPVLVGDASLPKAAALPQSLHPILSRQAAVLRRGHDFSADFKALLRHVRRHLGRWRWRRTHRPARPYWNEKSVESQSSPQPTSLEQLLESGLVDGLDVFYQADKIFALLDDAICDELASIDVEFEELSDDRAGLSDLLDRAAYATDIAERSSSDFHVELVEISDKIQERLDLIDRDAEDED